MANLTIEETELAESASRFWWLYLVTGVLWLWVTLIILSLDIDTVYAVSILFGRRDRAGINEFFAIGVSTRGWKIVHGALGVVFIAGIVAFFRPQGTFVALAAIVARVLLFKGIFDIVLALTSHPAHLWWVGLIVGVVEILLAFWAAGYFRGSAILLVVAWVAALTLLRGITEIVLAFRLRQLRLLRPATAWARKGDRRRAELRPDEPERRPHPACLGSRRRTLAGDALVVVCVVLSTAALLAVAWSTRAIITWVLAAGFLAFSIDPPRRNASPQGGRPRLDRAGDGGHRARPLRHRPDRHPGRRRRANALLDAVPEYAERLEDSGLIESTRRTRSRPPRTPPSRSPTSSAASARSWARSGRSRAARSPGS